jgi:hypothetical protein
MSIEDDCDDDFCLEIKELPFDAVKEGRKWQQMAQDGSKKEWDALQEWAKTFKTWRLDQLKPDLQGGVWAKATSEDHSVYPYPPALQKIRHMGLEFRDLIHRQGGWGLKWDLIRDHEEDRKFGQSTLHIHWSGDGGDYLLPHQDVKEKHTNVIISVMWGATLLFWKHGKKMNARHAAEEEVIIGLVDIDGGRVLDDQMGSAQMVGATHIHRTLMTDNNGATVDKSTWSSVYLQAGDAFP